MVVDKIVKGKFGSWEVYCHVDPNKAPLLVQATRGLGGGRWIDITRMTPEEAAKFGVKITMIKGRKQKRKAR